jgi:hypothetical protein
MLTPIDSGICAGKLCNKPGTIYLRLAVINLRGCFCEIHGESLLRDNLAVKEAIEAK